MKKEKQETTGQTQGTFFLNLGCLHPVACVRSGDGGFYIRLRNVAIVAISTNAARYKRRSL
jgi:hypothetical protein